MPHMEQAHVILGITITTSSTHTPKHLTPWGIAGCPG